MSTTLLEDERSAVDAQLMFPCRKCGVRPGAKCITGKGKKAAWQHRDRWDQVQYVVQAAGYMREVEHLAHLNRHLRHGITNAMRVESATGMRELLAKLVKEALF